MLFQDVKALADPVRAKASQRFFKTGIGEYGEGDLFLGLTVPQCRELAKKYQDLSFIDVTKILTSPIHEERLIALLILVERYKKAEKKDKEYIFHFYLAHIVYINNWDFVDLSADKIVGQWLFDNGKTLKIDLLTKLATSDSVWERRIAIMATFRFIKNNLPEETFRVAELLLNDTHDLIHKAVGWMLREVGKRCSVEVEESFLRKHYKNMPRTMLRYAIERFPEKKRLGYLQGRI